MARDIHKRRSWDFPKPAQTARLGADHFVRDPTSFLVEGPPDLERIDDELKAAQERENRAAEAERRGWLGAGNVRRGLFDWAINEFSQARDVYEELEHDVAQLEMTENLAVATAREGALSEALKLEMEAREQFARNGDERRRSLADCHLSAFEVRGGDCAPALDRLDEAFATARQIDDTGLKATALVNAGAAYCAIKDFPRAGRLFDRALLLALRAGAVEAMAQALNNRGVAFVNEGRQLEAIPRLEAALGLAQRTQDRPAAVEALNNILLAYTHHAEDEYVNAAHLFREELEQLVGALGERATHRDDDAAMISAPAFERPPDSLAGIRSPIVYDVPRVMLALPMRLAPGMPVTATLQ